MLVKLLDKSRTKHTIIKLLIGYVEQWTLDYLTLHHIHNLANTSHNVDESVGKKLKALDPQMSMCPLLFQNPGYATGFMSYFDSCFMYFYTLAHFPHSETSAFNGKTQSCSLIWPNLADNSFKFIKWKWLEITKNVGGKTQSQSLTTDDGKAQAEMLK